jgi:hypothetical protein
MVGIGGEVAAGLADVPVVPEAGGEGERDARRRPPGGTAALELAEVAFLAGQASDLAGTGAVAAPKGTDAGPPAHSCERPSTWPPRSLRAERVIPALEREINAEARSGVAAEAKVGEALARLRHAEGAEA